MKLVQIVIDTNKKYNAFLIDPNNVMYIDQGNLFLLGVTEGENGVYKQESAHVLLGKVSSDYTVETIQRAVDIMKSITFYDYLLMNHDRRIEIDFDVFHFKV